MEESARSVYFWLISRSQIFLFVLHVNLVYIMAQVAGGLVGAASTYGQYLQPINIHEGGSANRTIATGGLFAPFPVSDLAYTIFSYLFSDKP